MLTYRTHVRPILYTVQCCIKFWLSGAVLFARKVYAELQYFTRGFCAMSTLECPRGEIVPTVRMCLLPITYTRTISVTGRLFSCCVHDWTRVRVVFMTGHKIYSMQL